MRKLDTTSSTERVLVRTELVTFRYENYVLPCQLATMLIKKKTIKCLYYPVQFT